MGKNRVYEANWIVLFISLLINFAFTTIYVVEAIKGQGSWSIVIIFIMIWLGTAIYAWKLYLADSAHRKIKYATLYSFAIIYLYTMITFKQALTYMFVFIGVVLGTMYLEHRFIKTICCFALVGNIVNIVYMYLILGWCYENPSMAYINQIAGTLLIGIIFLLIKKIMVLPF
ncbi:MAG: hypothetical protein J6F30_08465 [Cellulosilyticum sp.]|nr:hypothetical protein [Cellulosilyticum sp.]